MMTRALSKRRLASACRRVFLHLTLAAGVAAAFASSAAQATEADCKAIADAMIANMKTPYHSYTTIAFEYAAPVAEARRKMGMPTSQESEAIFTGTDLFLKLPTGKWFNTHAPIEDVLAQVRTATGKFGNCERLADETLDGGIRSVYTAHSSDGKHQVTTKIWVATDRGLPVRSETDIGVMEAPEEAVAQQHIVTRSEYGDVQAPEIK
jgi:hypothetical protein